MTKEDITKLLAGRKLVDDYRNLDKETDYKSQLYANLKAAKTDVNAVALKIEIKRIDDKRDAATRKMNEGLKELGFETYSDFAKFNEEMNLSGFGESMKITKLSCDKCPTRRCVDLYKNSACYYKPMDDKKLVKIVKAHVDKYSDFCPKGYGYAWKQIKDFPFDIKWSA